MEKRKKEREAQSGNKRYREGKKGRKKQERRKSWKKAPCQALETVIHGDHLSKLQQNNAFVAINHTCVCVCVFVFVSGRWGASVYVCRGEISGPAY